MTFKDYAKQAKGRLKNGFWEQVKQERKFHRETVATSGTSIVPALVNQKDRLRNQIYSANFNREMEFEQKVIALLSAGEVSNPILLLADKEELAALPPSKRQAYLMNLSNKYRKIKEKYNTR